MNWILIALVAMFVLVGVLALIGARLPERYVARRRLTIARSPQQVWDALTDHAAEPQWRDELLRVEYYGDDKGKPIWTEFHKRGERRSLRTDESEPPIKLVRSLAVQRRHFSATWTYRLEPHNSDGTALTVREELTISHPVYRLLSRYIFADGAFTDRYLTALAAHLGTQAAAVERLDVEEPASGDVDEPS